MNNIIFNAENIISTLGIKVNEDYNIKFEYNSESIDITSRLFIESYTHFNSGCYMASDNFENTDKPGFVAVLGTRLSQDGLVTLKIDTESQQVRDLMTLVNHYVRFFMIIKDIRYFIGHFIELEIITAYTYTDSLILNNVDLFKLKINSPYETNYKMKNINIQREVNDYLSKLDIEKIELNMDVDALMVLVKMQKTLDSMVKI